MLRRTRQVDVRSVVLEPAAARVEVAAGAENTAPALAEEAATEREIIVVPARELHGRAAVVEDAVLEGRLRVAHPVVGVRLAQDRAALVARTDVAEREVGVAALRLELPFLVVPEAHGRTALPVHDKPEVAGEGESRVPDHAAAVRPLPDELRLLAATDHRRADEPTALIAPEQGIGDDVFAGGKEDDRPVLQAVERLLERLGVVRLAVAHGAEVLHVPPLGTGIPVEYGQFAECLRGKGADDKEEDGNSKYDLFHGEGILPFSPGAPNPRKRGSAAAGCFLLK